MLILTAAVWGSSYMFIKVALEDVSEGAIVCIRTALGAALLLGIAAHRHVLGVLRERLRWILVIAFIQVVGPFLLITHGETRISSSLTAILIASVPIFTALLALRFDHTERSQGWALAGVAIGIVGVVLLFGVDLSGDADELIGGAMMVLASLGYAISWMLVKHKMAGAAPEAVAGGTMLVAAVVTLPLLIAAPPDASIGFDALGSLIALGVGGTGLAFILFYTLIADIGPRRASIVSYVAPAFSIAYGVLLLGESLGPGAIAGLVLILAGSWLGAEGRLPGRPRISRSGPSRSSAPAPARAP
jgi:drug/metabolite transporter (DMT)-like permease